MPYCLICGNWFAPSYDADDCCGQECRNELRKGLNDRSDDFVEADGEADTDDVEMG